MITKHEKTQENSAWKFSNHSQIKYPEYRDKIKARNARDGVKTVGENPLEFRERRAVWLWNAVIKFLITEAPLVSPGVSTCAEFLADDFLFKWPWHADKPGVTIFPKKKKNRNKKKNRRTATASRINNSSEKMCYFFARATKGIYLFVTPFYTVFHENLSRP